MTHVNRGERSSIGGMRDRILGAAMILAFLAGGASADPIVSGSDAKGKHTPKAAATKEFIRTNLKAKGEVQTVFAFHDPLTPKAGVEKDLTKGAEKINPASVRHEYLNGEKHKTTGAVDYSLSLAVRDINGKEELSTRLTAKAELIPQQATDNTGGPVSIDTKYSDPFTHSATNLDANFSNLAGGLDNSLTIDPGTYLPIAYASGPGQSGAIAGQTWTEWACRIAPGVIGDPQGFWASGVTGAIDLYRVRISGNSSLQIAVDITFGSSNSFFDLEFKDSMGVSFDPTDPVAIQNLKNQISSAFAANAAIASVTPFTVGFVPTGADGTDFTFGDSQQQSLAGYEPVPAPGTLAALGLGCLAAARRRRAA